MKAAIVVLILNLLVSVTLNIVFYQRSRLDYITLNTVRLNPLNLNYFDHEPGWPTPDADQVNVIVLNSAEVLADTTGKVRKEYQIDELHINAAGYAALNQKLAPILTELRQ